MKCKKAKELIITGYIDGELDDRTRRSVREHIEVCSGCREYERLAREITVRPLEGLEGLTPPDTLWAGIKERIERRPSLPLLEPLLERMKDLFSVKRPMFALATAMAVMLMAAVLIKAPFVGPGPADMYIIDQMDFLYPAENGSEGHDYDNGSGLGTSIEEYFM